MRVRSNYSVIAILAASVAMPLTAACVAESVDPEVNNTVNVCVSNGGGSCDQSSRQPRKVPPTVVATSYAEGDDESGPDEFTQNYWDPVDVGGVIFTNITDTELARLKRVACQCGDPQ